MLSAACPSEERGGRSRCVGPDSPGADTVPREGIRLGPSNSGRPSGMSTTFRHLVYSSGRRKAPRWPSRERFDSRDRCTVGSWRD